METATAPTVTDSISGMDEFTRTLVDDHEIISGICASLQTAHAGLSAELEQSQARVKLLETTLNIANIRIRMARAALVRVSKCVALEESLADVQKTTAASALRRVRDIVEIEQDVDAGKTTHSAELAALVSLAQYGAAE